jgi:flagellar biosynthesis/type III secretory pathway protein FliH
MATQRPDCYGYELWGCRVRIEYPVVKLIDFENRWNFLEPADNPFSIVVMAHLKTLHTRLDPDDRFRWKLTLVKMLYERGYQKQDVIDLFRFIDWLMVLPEELEQGFMEILIQYEKEKMMPYVTSVERIGIQKGIQKGIEKGIEQGLLQGRQEAVLEILDTRFGSVPSFIAESVRKIKDYSTLRELIKKAAIIDSIGDFERDVRELLP